MTAYTAEFAAETAARLPFVRGSKEAAAKHLEAKLAGWKNDTRRDGDTPKEFWETVLSLLKK